MEKETEVSDMDKTSLKGAIGAFDKSFMNGMWSSIKAEFRDKREQKNAMNVDF